MKPQPYSKDQIRLRFIKAVNYILQTYDEVKNNDIVALLEIQPSNFSRVMNNEEFYPQDFWIGGICYHYNISAEYILTGNGELLSDKNLEKRVRALESKVAKLIGGK